MTHDSCQRKLTSLPQITLSARPVWFEGKVIGISDGDTIDVLN